VSRAAATAFTAFTGFHRPDQGNYVRFPVRAPGEVAGRLCATAGD